MEEQDPGEFAGGVEVGPVNSGSTTAGVEDEGLEGGVEGSQESEVGWAIGVLVFRMNGAGSLLMLLLPLSVVVPLHF